MPRKSIPNICSVVDCSEKHYARGWCRKHYQRWRKHGEVSLKLTEERGCSIKGCGGAHASRGWCDTHYRRWLKHGDTGTRLSLPQAVSMRERIETYSEKITESGCWVWGRALNFQGYGITTDGTGRSKAAHRASYETFIGPIPKGMWVLHKCDVPACVNPGHLFLGAQQDNVDDMHLKGRGVYGEKQWKSKLSILLVNEIRDKLAAESYLGLQKALAMEYGVSRSVICQIASGKSWAHLLKEGK